MIFFKKKRKKPKKPLDKIDRFVIGVMVYWVLFVAVMTVVFCFKGIVPDTLIQYALGGGAIELVCTALIEIVKEREGKKNERDSIHTGQTGSSGSCVLSDGVSDSVASDVGGCQDDGEGEVLG